MNKEVGKRWVEAGIILAKDPKAEVDCPACQMAVLLVTDAVSYTHLTLPTTPYV